MAKVDILTGIYTDAASDFRTSYPKNLMPIPLSTGISEGYLRPAEGLVEFGNATGTIAGGDRGGINWNGTYYRIIGTKLVPINSAGVIYDIFGDVGVGGTCTLDYSFDRLAIASGGRLYYYSHGVTSQVQDPDLGTVLDVLYVDGYFMTTDGTSLVVTDLNDPFSINPLKYGSAEADPDPIVGLLKLRDEPQAIGRYSIEAFQNVGGSLFPFQRINGATINRGAVGTHAATIFLESIAFLGGGRNEPPAVWLGSNGTSVNISSRSIDQILKKYTEAQLATVIMESRITNSQKLLYLHLPDQTLVYDAAASQVLGRPIWFILTSGVSGLGKYQARNFVWVYDRWHAGDPTNPRYCYLSDEVSTHYGAVNGWEFSTGIVYNEGNGALFHEMELVCLTGRSGLTATPTISTSYSVDGISWSQDKVRTLGLMGDTLKRITWFQQGFMRNWRVQRFKGTSDANLTIARLDILLEPLNG